MVSRIDSVHVATASRRAICSPEARAAPNMLGHAHTNTNAARAITGHRVTTPTGTATATAIAIRFPGVGPSRVAQPVPAARVDPRPVRLGCQPPSAATSSTTLAASPAPATKPSTVTAGHRAR